MMSLRFFFFFFKAGVKKRTANSPKKTTLGNLYYEKSVQVYYEKCSGDFFTHHFDDLWVGLFCEVSSADCDIIDELIEG